MVKCICVRGSLLFLLATVLVCRAGGKPSTWFPPGTRRAVHASDRFFYDFLRRDLSFPEMLNSSFYLRHFQNLKNIQHCLTFSLIHSHAGNFGLVEFGSWHLHKVGLHKLSSLRGSSFLKLLKYRNFLKIFWKFWKYSSKYQHFWKEILGFKTWVWSSTRADTPGKWNFNIIWRLWM